MTLRRPVLRSDTRAVSETLGYILVFSVIVMTISMATVFGIGGLEDRQATEQVTNVERAFDVLADNFADISRHDDPSRATEIRLAGGTIRVAEPVTITVGKWNPTNETFVDGATQSVTLQPLEFQSEGGSVVYESGVVFRADRAGSVARSPLPFVVGDDTAVVPVVATAGSSSTAVDGDRTVQVVGERRSPSQPLENRTIRLDDPESEQLLAMQIDSPRADGWAQQLEDDGYRNVSYNESTEQVFAELAVETDGEIRRPETVRLPVTNIRLRFA